MRYGVGLPSGEDRDPSLLPDLIRVFREVQQSDSTPFVTQLYFNSWFLHSLFDNTDVNVQLALRGRRIVTQKAYELSQAAIDPVSYLKHISPDEETHDILRMQKTLLRFARKKIEENSKNIPPGVFSRAQIAVRFNEYTDAQRESRSEARKETRDNRPNFVHHAGPFVPAHVCAHLMDMAGENLGRVCRTAHLESHYRDHLPRIEANLPIYDDLHEAGERTAQMAVNALRVMNKTMETALRAAAGTSHALSPEKEKIERRLIEELFIYSKIYRQAELPTPKPLERSADVIPFERLQQMRARTLQPA